MPGASSADERPPCAMEQPPRRDEPEIVMSFPIGYEPTEIDYRRERVAESFRAANGRGHHRDHRPDGRRFHLRRPPALGRGE